jgi:hypothetical protein
MFVELTLLGNEGIKHGQPLLLVKVNIVVSALNYNLLVFCHIGFLWIMRLEISPILCGALKWLLI